MTETITNAIATRDTGPSALIKEHSTDFATILPSHIKPETWIRLAQGALRRDKNLAAIAQRNPASLVSALLECARLGHEPGTEAFYLVPFGSEIQGIEGYRGVIERMYRAGAVTTVKAEVVHERDRFAYRPAVHEVPIHEPDWFGDRGAIIGAYSYAEMTDGTKSKVVILDRAYLDKVRAESKGSDKPTSPWNRWADRMVLKTAAHRLEPWVPTSTEYRREILRAARDVATETQAPPVDVSHLPVDEVIDGEFEESR